MPAQEKSRRELMFVVEDAAKRVARLHSMDADLVRSGAKAHGVSVVEGDLFKALVKHNYNPRLPAGTEREAEKLGQVSSLLVVCEDYRQSYEVANDHVLALSLDNTAVLATAGGAAQPDTERFTGDVSFLSAVLGLNPRAEVVLTHHIGVCGGANYYTNGHMKEVREKFGVGQEIEEMNNYGARMYEAIKANCPESRLSLWLSRVSDSDQYEGLVKLR